MRQFNMHEAKTNLSELVRLALEGEDIVLARNGTPLVRLIPIAAAAGLRPVGLNSHLPGQITEESSLEALKPLSPEELEAWHAPLLSDQK